MWADSLPAELPGKPWVFCASNWDPLCVSSPFTARPHQIHTAPAPVLCERLFSKGCWSHLCCLRELRVFIWEASWWAWATTTKYHRPPSGLDNRNLFPCTFRGLKLKIKVPAGLASGDRPSWLADGTFSLCPHMTEKQRKWALWSLPLRTLIHDGGNSWPHLNLTSSQRPHVHTIILEGYNSLHSIPSLSSQIHFLTCKTYSFHPKSQQS